MKNRARAVLAAASAIHFVHDGFSDILYVLLPLWVPLFLQLLPTSWRKR